jgi:hypothetical protein
VRRRHTVPKTSRCQKIVGERDLHHGANSFARVEIWSKNVSPIHARTAYIVISPVVKFSVSKKYSIKRPVAMQLCMQIFAPIHQVEKRLWQWQVKSRHTLQDISAHNENLKGQFGFSFLCGYCLNHVSITCNHLLYPTGDKRMQSARLHNFTKALPQCV